MYKEDQPIHVPQYIVDYTNKPLVENELYIILLTLFFGSIILKAISPKKENKENEDSFIFKIIKSLFK